MVSGNLEKAKRGITKAPNRFTKKDINMAEKTAIG
jgi:hypothetical protein